MEGDGQKVDEDSHSVKTKNELIKSIYNIVTCSISSYIQFYET